MRDCWCGIAIGLWLQFLSKNCNLEKWLNLLHKKQTGKSSGNTVSREVIINTAQVKTSSRRNSTADVSSSESLCDYGRLKFAGEALKQNDNHSHSRSRSRRRRPKGGLNRISRRITCSNCHTYKRLFARTRPPKSCHASTCARTNEPLATLDFPPSAFSYWLFPLVSFPLLFLTVFSFVCCV